MRFPTTPADKEEFTKNNINYVYNSTNKIWERSVQSSESIPEFSEEDNYTSGSFIKYKDNILIAKKDISPGVFNIIDWEIGGTSYRGYNLPCADFSSGDFIDFNQPVQLIDGIFTVEMMVKNISDDQYIFHTDINDSSPDKSFFGIFHVDNYLRIILLGEDATSNIDNLFWIINEDYMNQWIHLKVEIDTTSTIECRAWVNGEEKSLVEGGSTTGIFNPKGNLVSGKPIIMTAEGFSLTEYTHQLYNIKINNSYYPLQEDGEDKINSIDGEITSYNLFKGIQTTHSYLDSYGGEPITPETKILDFSNITEVKDIRTYTIEENNKYLLFGSYDPDVPYIYCYKKAHKDAVENELTYLGKVTHNNCGIRGMKFIGEDSDYAFFTSSSDNTSNHKRGTFHIKSNDTVEIINTAAIGYAHYAGPAYYLGNGIVQFGQSRDVIKVWKHNGSGSFSCFYTYGYVSSANSATISTVRADGKIILARRSDLAYIHVFYVDTKTPAVHHLTHINTSDNNLGGMLCIGNIYFFTSDVYKVIYAYQLSGENASAVMTFLDSYTLPDNRRFRHSPFHDSTNNRLMGIIETGNTTNEYYIREIKFDFATNTFLNAIGDEELTDNSLISYYGENNPYGCIASHTTKKIYYMNHYRLQHLKSAKINESLSLTPDFKKIEHAYRKGDLIQYNNTKFNITIVDSEEYTIQPDDMIIHCKNSIYNPMIIYIPETEFYTGRLIFIKDAELSSDSYNIRIQPENGRTINSMPYYDIHEAGKYVGLYCENDTFYFM